MINSNSAAFRPNQHSHSDTEVNNSNGNVDLSLWNKRTELEPIARKNIKPPIELNVFSPISDFKTSILISDASLSEEILLDYPRRNSILMQSDNNPFERIKSRTMNI
jgi:hypothetical protein